MSAPAGGLQHFYSSLFAQAMAHTAHTASRPLRHGGEGTAEEVRQLGSNLLPRVRACAHLLGGGAPSIAGGGRSIICDAAGRGAGFRRVRQPDSLGLRRATYRASV